MPGWFCSTTPLKAAGRCIRSIFEKWTDHSQYGWGMGMQQALYSDGKWVPTLVQETV